MWEYAFLGAQGAEAAVQGPHFENQCAEDEGKDNLSNWEDREKDGPRGSAPSLAASEDMEALSAPAR